MKSWILIVVVSFLCTPSCAQQSSISLLPRTSVPISRCRGDVNIFRCSGFGSFLGIVIPPLVPDDNFVVFLPTSSAGQVTTREDTFEAELVNVNPDGNGNAMLDAVFSFSDSDFGDSVENISVQCTIGPTESNLVNTTVLNVLDGPQPVQNVSFRGLLNSSQHDLIIGRLSWSDSSPRDVLYYQVIETSGQLNVTEVRSPNVLLNLVGNTSYSFMIVSMGLCGQSSVLFSFTTPDLGDGPTGGATPNSTQGLTIGIGVAGVIITLSILLAKHS